MIISAGFHVAPDQCQTKQMKSTTLDMFIEELVNGTRRVKKKEKKRIPTSNHLRHHWPSSKSVSHHGCCHSEHLLLRPWRGQKGIVLAFFEHLQLRRRDFPQHYGFIFCEAARYHFLAESQFMIPNFGFHPWHHLLNRGQT